MHKSFWLFFLLFSVSFINAQEISISSELNLRNYYAYDILGEVEDRIIVYRDKGFTKELDVFNHEMEHTQSAELVFEKKKVDVFNVVALDSVFQMLYGYFEKDSMIFRTRIYDRSITMTDSVTLTKVAKKSIRKKITHAISEDKSKILLSTMDGDDNVLFFLYNSKKRKIIWQDKIKIIGEVRQNLNDILIGNDGSFIIIIEDDEPGYNKNNFSILVFDPQRNNQQRIDFDFENIKHNDIVMELDNQNKHLILAGTYSEKKGKDVKGYFYLNKPISQLQAIEKFEFLNFPENLYEELLQGRKRKNKVLQDLKVQQVVLRNDGGMLIVSELEREFSRRNPYNTYSRNPYDSYSRRGWIDYYNDDIIVTNLEANGDIFWNKVLYKKQFSQDDDGVFSSFYIMKTPSRLRFIYNDEIKKNNTVSEYLVDPLGKLARNSLLSTEYQNMKLRFKDAIQISSNSILVPSEKNYTLNLVKITY